MAKDKNRLREHIMAVVLNRTSLEKDRRGEALSEFLALTVADLDPAQAGRLAEIVPPIMPALYEKWTAMFIDRLLSTVPLAQVRELCDGRRENDAALVLAYLMFMESARMEKQIERDLRDYGRIHGADNDLGGLAASYIKAKLARAEERARVSAEAEKN
ncbi:MAG: hypothetical protein PHV85_09255 [Desulfovibrionaceae bacterium]|nr:hypothetical protein [Desulfovibrionaceae bacterium]MDD4952721.1 hypothetical protein [Desulfovibrionaceae bacterium]